MKSTQYARSTIADTWRWLWPDVLVRILPLTAIPFLSISVLHLPPSFLGLTLNNLHEQLLVGFIVGIPMAAFAAVYRMNIVGPWFRRPTMGDHALQAFFYLIINAPAEELFFRGFLLTAIAQWTDWIGWGWLVSTALYALYHRLGKWNWRSVAGVGLAGIVFSVVYLAQPQPYSLLGVVIVHGLTTWGFLSLGDEVMYHFWRRKQR